MDDRLADAAQLIPPGPVVVALSGGPDSAVAAWLAMTRSDDVRAVFVDHGWPGSGRLRQAAGAVADRLGIPLDVAEVEPTSTETEARAVRLEVLLRKADQAIVVTGHHAGDVAETVLANLLRGAGATGLAGIPARRPPFVRPLLGIPAIEVRHAAVDLGLPFVDDPANADLAHQRNRIRHVVLPGLEGVAPGAGAALARSAASLAGDDAVLDAAATPVPIRCRGSAVLIPAGALATAPPPVAARIVRRGLRMAHPPYPGTAADVLAVLAAVTGPTAQLSGGLLATREGAFVALYPAGNEPPPPTAALAVPGHVTVGDFTVSAARIDPPRVAPLGKRVAWLDSSLQDLTVTTATGGDRIDLGGHTKTVSDALAEAGIPRRLRPGWPVVAAHGKIAWLAGVRVGAWARAGGAETAVLELRLEDT
ncbi:MAG: tRNA lysidine(34) synthetase TilS [Acidimicrobiia bacterium]|nr:tRNA lysidine(34) synthetase TilS [Acidimicrobiia bacterium]